MSDVQHLFHLSKLLESAIKSQDLQLAHELADQRLVLLDGIYHSKKYSQELINAVSVILNNEPLLTKTPLAWFDHSLARAEWRGFRDPERSGHRSVSTGSAENRVRRPR